MQVLKSNYRFIGGLSGFSQLCTFAVLTNVQYMLNMLDPRTQINNKILFAPNAVFMKDKLEEAASGTEKRRQMLEEQGLVQLEVDQLWRSLLEAPVEDLIAAALCLGPEEAKIAAEKKRLEDEARAAAEEAERIRLAEEAEKKRLEEEAAAKALAEK